MSSKLPKEQIIKNQLFNNLKNQGYEDQLKKQLRTKLIDKLKDKNMIGNNPQNKQKQLFQRVMSSLISQQLNYKDCHYTDSIYGIQSGYEGSLMSRNQLVQMMALKKHQLDQQQSLLQYLLRLKFPFNKQKLQSVQIQTNPQQIGFTIEQKLMMIDQQYRVALSSKENSNKSNIFDRKRVQLQLAEKNKKELDLFKEFQTHKIKVKVSQIWRKKFEDYSNHLNDQYMRKFEQIRKKERALNDEYVSKNTELNNKKIEIESLIKQKIDLLDMKQQTVKVQMENVVKDQKQFQCIRLKDQKQLKQKIKNYDNLILNVNQKIKFEVGVVKLSLQQEYQERQAENLRRKKVIDQDYGKLMGIKDTIDIVQKQNERLSTQNNLLREQLTTIEVELKNTVVELGNKVQRIQVLKDQLIQSKNKTKQVQQLTKQEVQKSKRYQGQILSMRRELQQIRQRISLQQNSSLEKSQSNIQQNQESKMRLTDIGRKLQMLKHERRKDIEKLKLGGKDN